jgi:hypothetical protein
MIFDSDLQLGEGAVLARIAERDKRLYLRA